ncbi:hypothetical protein CUS_4315 [Ruminococcus albus 8]|uniref:Uncharacterized protein n=1 Tax=Ruminococcus albus 8 TaxID=246199 RepID=E9SFL0_RUMAL|nr:hypothetical protein CUS_4315 [Ruminococcus albus 8]
MIAEAVRLQDTKQIVHSTANQQLHFICHIGFGTHHYDGNILDLWQKLLA